MLTATLAIVSKWNDNLVNLQAVYCQTKLSSVRCAMVVSFPLQNSKYEPKQSWPNQLL